MVGELIIDGIDVFTEYGIGIEDRGYTGLVQFQTMRNPPMNDWAEEHGIEVDLSDPKLENKTFTITFYGIRDNSLRQFIDFLDEQVYHTFQINNIGLTRTLRFTRMINRRTVNTMQLSDLEFADDKYPFDGYAPTSLIPISGIWQTGIDIDNISLSDYGIWFTDGEKDEILVVGDIKKALTINVISQNSVLYDSGADIKYGDREITVNLALWANKATFWNNWNRFFYDLTRPNEREMYYNVRDDSYPFFYKSCSVRRFEKDYNGKLYCEFSIKIHFTKALVSELWYLLATGKTYGLVKLDSTDIMVDTNLKPARNPS